MVKIQFYTKKKLKFLSSLFIKERERERGGRERERERDLKYYNNKK